MFKYREAPFKSMDWLRLLDEAATVNARLVSLPRIKLMQTFALYGPDGIEFRELQASMGMSDGKLLSNLYALRDLGVIEEQKTKIENKRLTTYRITKAGYAEWARTRTWLRDWLGSNDES